MNHAVAEPQPVIDHQLDFPAAGPGLTDQHVDVVFLETLQSLRQLRRTEIDHLAVDARSPVSQTARTGNHFFVKSLPAADNGTQDHHLFATIRPRDAVENLTSGERPNLTPALDAVLLADFRIKQSQVMVDFGDGCDGGFFSSLAETLLDGDRRRNSGKQIHIRTGHHLEKLAGVSGKAVDVPSLAFSIDDVKRQ